MSAAPAQRPIALCLMGPTASGKTGLAVALQEALGGDIISVDSALVYRHMNIGTAKPDAQLQARAPHRLIDIREPEETYSAAEFRDDALGEIERSQQRGRVPLLVGGTMLYFRALLEGIDNMPSADGPTRERLEWEWRHDCERMHGRLEAIDPVAAQKIHPHNRQRLVRALEVYELTGEPISAFWQGAEAQALPFEPVLLALAPAQRDLLHQRIQQRFSDMLVQGLVDEVRELHRRPGLSSQTPSMRSVGYRQVWQYLDGDGDYDTMVFRALAATRQLAKRQLTWLRRWPGVTWLDSDAPDLSDRALKIARNNATLRSN